MSASTAMPSLRCMRADAGSLGRLPPTSYQQLIERTMFGEPKRGPSPPQRVGSELEKPKFQRIQAFSEQLSPGRHRRDKQSLWSHILLPQPQPAKGHCDGQRN